MNTIAIQQKQFTNLSLTGHFVLILLIQGIAGIFALPFYFLQSEPFRMFIETPNFLILATFFGQLAGVFYLVRLFKNSGLELKNYLNIESLNSSWVKTMLVWAVGLIGGIELVTQFLSIPPNQEMMSLMQGNLVLVFVSIVVMAPVFEEMLFRGFLLNELNKRYSDAVSILVTALIFTVIHAQYNLTELSFILAVGLGLGFVRLKYKNILIPIGIHALNNLVSVILYLYVH